MQFTTKIEQACANKSDVRYCLHGVLIDPDHKVAVATNGQIMAITPVDIEGEQLQDRIMPLESVKAAQKKECGFELTDTGVKVSNCESVSDFKYVDGKFPNYRAVIEPKTDNYIVLNAELLVRLQRALTDKGRTDAGVKLYIPETAGDGCRVESTTNPDNYGVIMPMIDK